MEGVAHKGMNHVSCVLGRLRRGVQITPLVWALKDEEGYTHRLDQWRIHHMPRSGGRTSTGTSEIYNSNNSSNLLSTYYVPCQVLHTCSVISVFPTTLQGDRNYRYSHFTNEEMKAQRGSAAQHRAGMWESQNLKAGLSLQRQCSSPTTLCLPWIRSGFAVLTHLLWDQQALNIGPFP